MFAAATNLGARVLCDLMLERQTDLTRLARVDDTPRKWEPEPLRWLGYTCGSILAGTVDHIVHLGTCKNPQSGANKAYYFDSGHRGDV